MRDNEHEESENENGFDFSFARGGRRRKEPPHGWEAWLRELFGGTYREPMASYHREMWEWLWTLRPEKQAAPYLAIWPRGWAKSTNAETGVIALAAHGYRYALYVSATQAQADDHVLSVSERLATVGDWYPQLAEARVQVVGARGRQLGWRHNRVWTADGFVLDGLGLDKALRGAKLLDDRPDVILLDDLDDTSDSPETIERNISAITRRILPAAAPTVAVLVLQNLVHRNGIVSRMADGRADFLTDRIMSGPHPAIEDMEWEGDGAEAVITGGKPTWAALGIEACQAKIRLMGLTAFLAECQHDVPLSGQPRFNLSMLGVMASQTQRPLAGKLLPANLQGREGLRVYSLPEPGINYALYVDPAEGKGRDYTATTVMDARGMRVVAVLEDNTREPQMHADIAADLALWYNDAYVGYERARGESIALVFGRRGVRNLYAHVDTPLTQQQLARGERPRMSVGYPMNQTTKRTLIEGLAALIDVHGTTTPDERQIDQAMNYVVTERMLTQASPGGHDDLVISWAGCCMLAQEIRDQRAQDAYGERRSNVRGYTPTRRY